jgi:hypothetical protein
MVEPARIPKEFVVPGFTIGVAGDVTIAVAVPKIVPLVALTVLVNVPTAPPAVKGAVSPVVPAGIVPPPAVTDHVGANGEMTFPLASLPTAVYVIVVLMGSVPGFGVTVIVASAPAVTVIVAVAVTLLQVTVTVNVPAVVPAVYNPVLVIVPPPLLTAQMGSGIARMSPSAFFATTVNCCVPPGRRVTEVGEMVIVEVRPGSVELEQAAVKTPANATATMTPAIRAR